MVFPSREVGHDIGDRSTWETTTNPMLCMADLMYDGRYGLARALDWDSVDTCADADDETLASQTSQMHVACA